jgi:hypothetical protein
MVVERSAEGKIRVSARAIEEKQREMDIQRAELTNVGGNLHFSCATCGQACLGLAFDWLGAIIFLAYEEILVCCGALAAYYFAGGPELHRLGNS